MFCCNCGHAKELHSGPNTECEARCVCTKFVIGTTKIARELWIALHESDISGQYHGILDRYREAVGILPEHELNSRPVSLEESLELLNLYSPNRPDSK